MAFQLNYRSNTGARFGLAYVRVMVVNLRYSDDPPAAVIHLGVWPNAKAAKDNTEPLQVYAYTAPLSDLGKMVRAGDRSDIRASIYRWLKKQRDAQPGQPDLRKAKKI